MARPPKDNADYFSHVSGLRNDPRVKGLRRRFKHTGYSCFTMLREHIAQASYFHLHIDAEGLENIAADLDVDTDELTRIIEYCVERGLLQRREDFLTDHDMILSLSDLLDKRTIGAAQIISGEYTKVSDKKTGVSASETNVSGIDNPQRKVKESKSNTLTSENSSSNSSDGKKGTEKEAAHKSSTGQQKDEKESAGNKAESVPAIYRTDLVRIEDLAKRLKEETSWMEMVMMKNAGVNWSNLQVYLDRFIDHISQDVTKDTERVVSFTDKKKHFRSWLPLHLQAASNQPAKTGGKKDIADYI